MAKTLRPFGNEAAQLKANELFNMMFMAHYKGNLPEKTVRKIAQEALKASLIFADEMENHEVAVQNQMADEVEKKFSSLELDEEYLVYINDTVQTVEIAIILPTDLKLAYRQLVGTAGWGEKCYVNAEEFFGEMRAKKKA